MERSNISNFFAMISRMKYIERWALMHNTRRENISEHSLEVSMLAHAMATIGNVRYGKQLNAEKAALIGLYHDASEIITGDMPTPIKYYNSEMKHLFHKIEDEACERMIDMLPEDMQPAYRELFFKQEDDQYLWKIIKAADKLSAYIKCMEEENAGNKEFASAKLTLEESLNQLETEVSELADFRNEFLPAFGKNLDELQRD